MFNKGPPNHNLIGPSRDTTLNNLIISHSLDEQIITLDTMGASVMYFLLNGLSKVVLDGHDGDVLVVGVVFEQVDFFVEKVLQNNNLRFLKVESLV